MNTREWIDRLPLLLDARDRGRKLLREFCHYLADHADPDGTNVFPSIDKVGNWLHVTRRTTLGLYRQAEEAKLIVIEKRGHRLIKARLNFDIPFEEMDLPARAVADERRRKASERVRRHRARKAEIGPDRCAPIPVTDFIRGVNEDAPIPVTRQDQDAPIPVTSMAAPPIDQQQDHHQGTTAAADATPAGEILDAELVDDELPGIEGPPLLAIDPPSTELVRAQALVPAVPNLSASWLLPEPAETGKRKRTAPVDAPRFHAEAWQMPREQHAPSEWVKTLVGMFVEAARGFGFEPSGRQVGQVGKEVKGLVAAGNNPLHILAAVRRAAEKRGAWVLRAMADVQPGNWSAQRPGRQIITPQGPVQLPQGMSAGDRRSASIAAW